MLSMVAAERLMVTNDMVLSLDLVFAGRLAPFPVDALC